MLVRKKGFWRTAILYLSCGAVILLWPHALRAQSAQPSRLPPSSTTAKQEALDLNTAGIADLRRLPGIGDAYAKRIVEGRPYTAKNQLVTRGVLPQTAYEQIKDSVVARHSPAK